MSEGSFARNHLERYGWEQGKGLGRTETGIKDAIKPKLKFDTAGIGHDAGEQFSFHWWDHVFNKAAKSIHVENSEEGVQVKQKGTKSNLISNKKTTYENKTKPLLYGSFVKHGTLNPNGNISEDRTSSSSSEESDDDDKPPETYEGNDEMLFKACGGRTAHKGARHGLHLSGKLQRIEEQENLHSNMMKMRKQTKDEMETEEGSLQKESRKGNKKKKKSKERSESDCLVDSKESSLSVNNLEGEHEDSNSLKKKKKKKKSKNMKSFDLEIEGSPNAFTDVKQELIMTTSSKPHDKEFVQECDTLNDTNSRKKKFKKSKKIQERTNVKVGVEEDVEGDEIKAVRHKSKKVKKIKERTKSKTSQEAVLGAVDGNNIDCVYEGENFRQKKSKKPKEKGEKIKGLVILENREDQCPGTKSGYKESKRKRKKGEVTDSEVAIIENVVEDDGEGRRPKKKKKKKSE